MIYNNRTWDDDVDTEFTAKTQDRKFKTNTVFPEKELRGYSPNSYIHVSVSDLYISLVGLHILLQENRWTERGNIYRSLTETHAFVEIRTVRPRNSFSGNT